MADKNNPIFRSLELIEEHITERLTVENIASAVYFSKHHYGRLFREIVGDSVMEYVTKRKLTLAGRSLLESTASIIDIATEYGYNSREGFSRAFKAYMGVSPSEYRKYSLAAISQKNFKERMAMMYSKTTNEIIRELNEFIAKAKELSDSARRIDSKWYAEFWAGVADDTDAMSDRIKATLDRVTSIAEHPDEITNRFAILKVIEDTAFEMNVMALHVGLTAIGRAKPEDAEINKPLCRKYAELAQMPSMKAGAIAKYLSELAALIIDDMRKTAEQKIKDVIQKGKEAAAKIDSPSVYIRDELNLITGELESTPVESVTVSMLDEYLFKLKIVSLAAKVDTLRHPPSKPMLDGIAVFVDSVETTADFCRTIVKPDSIPPTERGLNKRFIDIAYQGNTLRFYVKGELEKMGRLLDDEHQAVWKQIDSKIDSFIEAAYNATDESAYKEIADRLHSIAVDMTAEAEKWERPHLECGAEQHAHTALPHFREQFLFFRLCVGVVDERYLMLRYPAFDKFGPYIVVYVEAPVLVRRREVREHQLRQPVALRLAPYVENPVRAGIYLAALEVWQERVCQALIQPDFSPVRRDFQHVIDPCVNQVGVDNRGALGKLLNHFLLHFGRLHDDVLEL